MKHENGFQEEEQVDQENHGTDERICQLTEEIYKRINCEAKRNGLRIVANCPAIQNCFISRIKEKGDWWSIEGSTLGNS